MRDPWTWKEGQCWHERDTNGDPYRCPVTDCWWNASPVARQAARRRQ